MSKLNFNGTALKGGREYKTANFSLVGIFNMIKNK